MCLLFAGCKNAPDNEPSSKANEGGTNENQVWMYSIQFTLASKNDNHIYSAKFPYYFYKLDSYSKEIKMCDFAEKPNKTISREDFNLFNDFVNKHADDKKSDNSVFAYSIYFAYYDEEGNRQANYCEGHDSFPEEINELVDKFNELCGQVVLSHPDKVQKLTGEFIRDELQVNDYPVEAIDEMIENSYLSFGRFVGSIGSLESYMKGYEHSLDEEKIKDIMPTELRPEVAVTDEEFDEFLKAFLRQLGDEWEIDEYSGQVDLTLLVNKETGQSMYVGKASALNAYTVRFDSDEARMDLDAHMEGMTVSVDFMYNMSGAYILADFKGCDNFVDIANTFYSLE